MIRVYIASPYSVGDKLENAHVQMSTADELMDLGFCPYAPLLSHFQDFFYPRSYDDWMKIDMEWVSACDVVLRLPGASPGADREVALAKSLGKPVYYSIEELEAASG